MFYKRPCIFHFLHDSQRHGRRPRAGPRRPTARPPLRGLRLSVWATSLGGKRADRTRAETCPAATPRPFRSEPTLRALLGKAELSPGPPRGNERVIVRRPPPRPLAPQPHPSQAQGSHRDAAGAWLERHFSLEGVGPLPDLPGKPGGTAHPVPETWLLRERGMWPLELPLVPRRLGPGWRPLRTATENPATPPHPWSHPVPAGAALVTRGGDVAWSASWLMSWASASASGQKKNLRTQEANEIFGQENDL